MNIRSYLILMTALILMLSACSEKVPTDLAQTAFIPQPASVTATGEAFEINNSNIVYVQEGVEGLQTVADYLAGELNRITGYTLTTQTVNSVPSKGIYLSVSPNSDLKAEGYELNIGKKLVTVQGTDLAGTFYGIQTLLQALPVKAVAGEPLYVATGVIRDFPEYGYRGMMLDVARHFFSVDDVKRVIDLCAYYKINTLHLHLSDDQGWRIEIKSWPKLTEIGGSTQVGGGKGGFYTQEQYKEIVQYAVDRQIIIVPEIDMPGHTNAALASYPELNPDGKARELYTGIEVGFSTLATNMDITYQFVEDVIRELAAITPGPYFHIGGDESHVTKHDDYVYFINRIQPLVTKYGKKIVGWDEIANADLEEDVTVQFWSNVKNTSMGLEKGAKVLVSPGARTYMDMKYDSTTVLGLKWAGFIEVDHAYTWSPDTVVPGLQKEQILGIEAPLWSETLEKIEDIEFMVFPRLPGYAEIGWTANDLRNWDEYKLRLAKHGKRFEDYNINFYRSPLVPWEK